MKTNVTLENDEVTFEFVPGAVKPAMAGCKSSDLWKVPVDRIRVIKGFNPRLMTESYKARIRSIADSIIANGFYADQPLAGYVAKEGNDNVVYVTNGHTRLEAVKLAISEGAQITEVPMVTKPNGTSMEDLTVSLVTSNTGAPLTPYETAVVCKRLIGYGVDESEIASRLGVSITQVKNYLMLMSAPREIHQLVIEEKVSATLAIETFRKRGTEAVEMLRQGVVNAESTGKVRATQKDVQKSSKGAAGARRLPKAHIQRSISWVVENKLDKDERILKLLAFLSGTEVEEVRQMIEAPAKGDPDDGGNSAGEESELDRVANA